MKMNMVLPGKFARSLDRTDREMWIMGSMRYMGLIYLQKVLRQERYFHRW